MLKTLCIALVLAVCPLALSQSVSGKATVAGVGGANDATRPTHAQIAALYSACLIHGWPGNDAAGSVIHDVFGTDNLTINGTVTWQKNGTLPGLTPFFNGAGYAIGSEYTDTNFDASSAFTVVFWTVGSSSAGYSTQQYLVGNWAFDATGSQTGWGIFQNANAASGANPVDANAGIFNLFANEVCCSGGGAIQVNPTTTSIVAPITHFYAVSYDGSKANTGVTIVFDGTTYSTTNSNLTTVFDNLTGNTATASSPIQIGESPGGTTIPYIGAIADLAVYNCGISATTLLSWEALGPRIN
jgi:hypothetical protein